MIRYLLLSLLIISSNCTYPTKNQNDIIKEYYNREFVISDNDYTYNLLEYIASPNIKHEDIGDAINIFCEICLVSDGALAEMLSDYCIIMIERYPKQIISRMVDCNELLCSYGTLLASDFYYRDIKPTSPIFNNFFDKIKNRLNNENNLLLTFSKLEKYVIQILRKQ